MTTVLVVDDHAALRGEIVNLVHGHDMLEVVGEAASGEEAIQMARSLHPDVVLMDIVLPQMSGVDATRKILGENPDTLVLAVSNYANPGLVRKMLELGARGYVRKDHVFEELRQAIDEVLQSRRFIGAGIKFNGN